MDLTVPRWHPTKYYHHLITSYLSKAKEKHRPLTPITICTPFFLEDLVSSTRTVETDFMLYEKDLRSHQLVIMPVKVQAGKKEGQTSGISMAKDEVWKGKWTLYIVIRGETKLSRFPAGAKNGNLVMLIIGDRNIDYENEILQMLYLKGKHRLPIGCPAYGYHLGNADEIWNKYLPPSCTKYADWVMKGDERDEWMNAWKVIGIAEAVLQDTTKTKLELLEMEGEVVSLEIPAGIV